MTKWGAVKYMIWFVFCKWLPNNDNIRVVPVEDKVRIFPHKLSTNPRNH